MLKSENLPRVKLKKGEVIFRKGDLPDNRVYIIESGQVAITSNVGGQDVHIDLLTRGDFVGEMALIDDQPRSATAIVEEETLCMVLTKSQVDKALNEADFLAYTLVRTLNQRLRRLTERADSYFSDGDEDND